MRVRVVTHHRVGITTARILRRRRRVTSHTARGIRGVWRRRCSRSVGVAAVGSLLHNRVAWLEGRQRVGRCRRRLMRVVRVMRMLLLMLLLLQLLLRREVR